jgi:hypothetical protein
VEDSRRSNSNREWKPREIATVEHRGAGGFQGSTQGAKHVPENEQDHGAKADEHRDHGENVGQFGHGHEHGGHGWDAGWEGTHSDGSLGGCHRWSRLRADLTRESRPYSGTQHLLISYDRQLSVNNNTAVYSFQLSLGSERLAHLAAKFATQGLPRAPVMSLPVCRWHCCGWWCLRARWYAARSTFVCYRLRSGH